MALKPEYVKQVISWLLGMPPILFYAALAIVCGLNERWIACAFASASALALFVWFLLNCVTIISVVLLALSHANAVKRTRRDDDRMQRGSDAVCDYPQGDRFITDVDWDPVDAQQSEDEGMLSSIPDSSKANAHTLGSSSCSSIIQEDSSRAPVNPLHTLRQSFPSVNVGPQAAAQPCGELVVTPRLEKAMLSPLQKTGVLLPLSSLENLYTKDAASPIPACPPMKSSNMQSYPAEGINADRNLSGSAENEAHARKDQVLSCAKRLPDSVHTSTGVRHTSAPPTAVPVRPASTSKPLRIALMMPVLSVYMTIIITILTLTGSLMFEYDTHCLFLASPVLGVPWLWANLMLIKKAFRNIPHIRGSFHFRVVSVLTHWLSMGTVYAASIGVFSAACTLETIYWKPYYVGDDLTPRAIRVVSYFSPMLIMLSVGIFLNNFKAMLGATWEAHENEEMAAGRVSSTTNYCECSPGHSAIPALTPEAKPHGCSGRPSPSVGISSVSGGSSPRPAGTVSVAEARAHMQPQMMYPSAPQPLPEETCSTLSSIVRSFAGGTLFIPHLNGGLPAKLSVSKSFRRSTQSCTNGGSDQYNSSQPVAFMTSVPQLKTVTILYVAYRDIYADDAEAETSAFTAFNLKGGMAATRNKQRTVSANFEAVMEALEETRSHDSADANSYVLTAYEDSICLVWGLIPFSSEPVLLAVEKARKIIEAFKNRPKPPSGHSNARQELVAAVVSAPHSLVGLVGSGSCRGIHFFNPHQHELGAQMLRRGLAMHRCLPSLQASLNEPENPFQCILLDDRSWNSTASHILARPCGIIRIDGGSADAKRPMQGSLPLNVSSKSTHLQFLIFYNFMEKLQAMEEEWHLVVQRQEHLGSKFSFLSEAVQLLHQGDQSSAQQVLKGAVQGITSSSDADNITIAQMLLEDLSSAQGCSSEKM